MELNENVQLFMLALLLGFEAAVCVELRRHLKVQKLARQIEDAEQASGTPVRHLRVVR